MQEQVDVSSGKNGRQSFLEADERCGLVKENRSQRSGHTRGQHDA